jgi:hypothetical protein
VSKFKMFLFSTVLALAAQAAFASQGSWSNVTVTSIIDYVGTGGVIEVQLSANSTGGPACATTTNRVVIDPSNPAGAYAAAVAQSARLSGATISFTGAGTCALVSGIETLNYLQE